MYPTQTLIRMTGPKWKVRGINPGNCYIVQFKQPDTLFFTANGRGMDGFEQKGCVGICGGTLLFSLPNDKINVSRHT
jgi:hypothetical protein